MINVLKLQPCETCKGATMLIENSGPMRGIVIPCPSCAGSWEKFMKQYGTDHEESPEVYIDMSGAQPILQKIDKKKDYILLPNKQEIFIS